MGGNHRFIRFGSHRARDYGFRVLGLDNQRTQSFYSLRRNTASGGVYLLTPEQIAAIRGQHLVNFTVLRGPFDDLLHCWSNELLECPCDKCAAIVDNA